VLFGAWGAGGLVASVTYPAMVRTAGEIRVLLGSTSLSVVLGVAVALSHSWLVAVVAIVAWSVPISIGMLNAITLRAKVTPDRLQSRVNTAGRMVGFGFGTPIGAVVGGVVTQGYGPTAAVLTAAAAQGLAAGVAWVSPLRRYRADPGAVAAAE
jgi:predicted MFS family arabinose efflux permease